jgi:hypothetical protein
LSFLAGISPRGISFYGSFSRSFSRAVSGGYADNTQSAQRLHLCEPWALAQLKYIANAGALRHHVKGFVAFFDSNVRQIKRNSARLPL